MKKLKNKPILTSVLITALFLAVVDIIGFVWFLPAGEFSAIIYELVMMLVPFVFVCIFGDVKIYTKKGFFKTLRAGAYIFVVESLYLLAMAGESAVSEDTVWVGAGSAVLGALTLLGIGFREESIFRGIFVNRIGKKYIKDRKGILITAWSSGAIFGLVHLTNVFSGVDLFSAFIQSVVAAGVGFYLAAVYLRGGNLWALILVHAITDGASMFQAIFTSNNGNMVEVMDSIGILNLTPFFVFCFIGSFLLRDQECPKIIERFNPEEKPEC